MNHVEADAMNDGHPIRLSRVARVVGAYRRPILLALASVILGFSAVAALVLFTSPAAVVTTQSFRLEFEGASEGLYPNGVRFSPAEIVSVPVLLKVYEANELARFLPFEDFARALYVVESNAALERLSRDYGARLADPKLTPVDRERIVREFESKRSGMDKSEYAISFSTPRGAPPKPVVIKVLAEVLREWSSYAAREQRVLQYQVAVLSPSTIEDGAAAGNYLARLRVLRSNAYRAIQNIEELLELPGARLARTQGDQLSLNDIRIRLEDLVRFRLEPLVPAVHESGLAPAGEALRFYEAQLAYDERELLAARGRANLIREALDAYAREPDHGGREQIAAGGVLPQSPSVDTVTPQLSEGFLDRLLAMTQASGDVQYRQDLVDDYREAAAVVVPLEQATAYDRHVIAKLRSPGGNSGELSARQVEEEIRGLHQEARDAVQKMNELYATISSHLEPATHMFVATSAPSVTTTPAVRWQALALLGMVVTLLSIPLIVGGALIHDRLRHELAAEKHPYEAAEAAGR